MEKSKKNTARQKQANHQGAKQGTRQKFKQNTKQSVTQSAKQSTRQSTKQGVKQSTKQGTKQVIRQSDNLETKQGVSQGVKQEEKRRARKSPCPVAEKCGGCQWIHISYEEQLKKKEEMVAKLCKPYFKPEPIIGMENPYHYRNKVHAVFGMERKKPVCGIYEEGTHRIVPVEGCLIENEKAGKIIQSIRELARPFKIRHYDEDTGYGLLRHVLIRVGHNSGEILVVLVISSPVFPSKNNFVKALLKIHPEITSIVANINNRNTNMILGDKEQILYGKGYIQDTLCGKTFRISPKSFYQVNSTQTEVLYKKAMEYAGLTGKEVVLDAYCGTGTIGLISSEKAKKVIGVELNRDAVRDAVVNARINNITNTDFYLNDAGKFMEEMAEQGAQVDVVFMDPPRAGSDEAFLGSLVKLAPTKVVYVSCNPVTLVRDLEFLKKKGYSVKRGVALDQFAWTGHVEVCCLMSRVDK